MVWSGRTQHRDDILTGQNQVSRFLWSLTSQDVKNMSHCIGDIADATGVYCPLECTRIEHRILSIDDLTFCEFYSGYG